MLKSLLAGTAMALFPLLICAQNFGGNPATTKWQQQNNEAVRVVYPAGIDSIAANIAWVAQRLADNPQTVGNRLKKITVLLQPELTRSNAYVALGPWRSEYFVTPPQNPFELGSQDWVTNLAVHEFRHVQQFSNYNAGLTKFVGTIFGQLGQALATAAAVPDWYFEGDAVWSETKNSTVGRGRLPLFFNEYKSVDDAGKWYSWMKWRNGSLKDLVPNHYPTGYMLAAYGRLQYGDTIWNTITENAARYKSLFYPMQGAFKRQTGKAYNSFTAEAFQFYRDKWKQEAQYAAPEWITATQHNNVLDYKYPYPSADGGMVALKRSYRDIPSIVLIDKQGKEQRIVTRDIDNDDYFSYNNGRIVFTFRQPNARWGNIDYSNIRIVDIGSGKNSTITIKGKYFSPDIHPQGNLIVAVHADNNESATVQIINGNGVVQAKGSLSPELFYSHPKFLPDGETVIVAARNKAGEMFWVRWQYKNNQWEQLTKAVAGMVGFPVVQQDNLYFTATAGDHDALFALNLANKQIEQVAGSHTGIYQGFVRDGKATGSYYTNMGHRLGSTAADNQSVRELPPVRNLYVGAQIEGQSLAPTITTAQSGAVKKYAKATGLFNFHSLVPNISESDIQLSLLGQNVLNTLQSNLYYVYNTNESSHRLGYNGIYGQWYLQPVINISQTWNRSIALNADTTFRYNETSFAAGLRLPLNFTKGKQFRNLVLQSTYNYEELKWTGIADRLLRNNDFTYINNSISYSSFSQQALQHILPRWGHQASVVYQTSLSSRKAWQTLTRLSLFLPGFAKTHNIVLQGAWQGRDTALNYIYTNNFPFARGYTTPNFPRMWRFNINYHLPLWYPDWGFANIVYFRRIRTNLFYDYSATKSLRTGLIRNYRSTGSEIYFDTRWGNQQNISFGIRYSRLLDADPGRLGPNQWEFILPINLLSL